MLKYILSAILLLCCQGLVAEVCAPMADSEKQDVQDVNTVESAWHCSVDGKIQKGICLTIFYNRYPNPTHTAYAVDFDTKHASYFTSVSNIYSKKSKIKTKTIKLHKDQLAQLNCLANAVWRHKNSYPEQERLRKEKARQQEEENVKRKLTEVAVQKPECLQKHKQDPQACMVVDSITAKDIGPWPDYSPQNDLLGESIHDSQYLTLFDGADAKLVGRTRAYLTGEAGALHGYLESLFKK